MDDLISRQAAIDICIVLCNEALCRYPKDEGVSEFVYRGVIAMRKLPSAERRGRWITYKRHAQGSPYIAFGEDGKPFIQHHQIEVTRYKCSLCGVVEDVNTPFCSECGVKMDEVEE